MFLCLLAFSYHAHLASAHLVFLNIAFIQDISMHVCVCVCVCVCIPVPDVFSYIFNCSELQLLK